MVLVKNTNTSTDLNKKTEIHTQNWLIFDKEKGRKNKLLSTFSFFSDAGDKRLH